MKKFVILTALISAFVFNVACAKTPVKNPLKTSEKLIQCTREMSNYEYLECIQKNNEIYEKQINRIYLELKNKLDEDAIHLTKSQKAWKTYRDNSCALSTTHKRVGYSLGASIGLISAECINSFNQNRLKELNTLKSEIEEFEKE